MDIFQSPETGRHFHKMCLAFILTKGTQKQQEEALTLSPQMDLKYEEQDFACYSPDTVESKGTAFQKTYFCGILEPLFSNHLFPLGYRRSIGKFLETNGNPNQNRLVDIMIVSNPQLSSVAHHREIPAVIAPTPDQYSALMDHLDREPDFYNFVPTAIRRQMIRHLWTHPQDTWQAHLQATVAQHRPMAEPQAARGAAFEIHTYAASIQKTVLSRIEAELKGILLIPQAEAQKAVNSWMTLNVDFKKSPNARRAIGGGLKIKNALDSLAKVYTFVQTKHGDKMSIFMKGFVEESLQAYEKSKNPESCAKGVEERIVTALRGIAFDDLFQSPETEGTAKIFMTSCNFVNDPRWMVQKLIELGVTGETEGIDASKLFETFSVAHIKDLHLGAQEQNYMEQVQTLVQTIEDFYEDRLKSEILKAQRTLESKKRKTAEDHAFQVRPAQRGASPTT